MVGMSIQENEDKRPNPLGLRATSHLATVDLIVSSIILRPMYRNLRVGHGHT